ncbi:MAG: lipid-binding SYLF domain-containing protein [Planctomycetaceae bacterium]|nr:lipid-binding SYLF domain-containing protein [Planctomycetaceae bacterium]
MSTLYRRVLCLLAVVLLGGGYGWAASRSEVANKLEDFRQFFVDFQLAPDSGIPGDLLAECYGVIIMRQYKAGFIFGARVGHGVIFMHDRFTGEWSPPAFVRSADGSFGFQIGGQSVDAIILIMNQEGVDMLLKTRFSIGVDASAAAGPVGRDMSAQVGPGTALLTYSRAKGLYAGASFEGGAFLNNNDYNLALYGRPVGIRDILLNRQVAMPPEAHPIISTLQQYATSGGPATPAQPSTGGLPPRIGSVTPAPEY